MYARACMCIYVHAHPHRRAHNRYQPFRHSVCMDHCLAHTIVANLSKLTSHGATPGQRLDDPSSQPSASVSHHTCPDSTARSGISHRVSVHVSVLCPLSVTHCIIDRPTTLQPQECDTKLLRWDVTSRSDQITPQDLQQGHTELHCHYGMSHRVDISTHHRSRHSFKLSDPHHMLPIGCNTRLVRNVKSVFPLFLSC